jgi:hypothetical protein
MALCYDLHSTSQYVTHSPRIGYLGRNEMSSTLAPKYQLNLRTEPSAIDISLAG